MGKVVAVNIEKPISIEQFIMKGYQVTSYLHFEELEPKELALLYLVTDPKGYRNITMQVSAEKLYHILQEVDAYRYCDLRTLNESSRRVLGIGDASIEGDERLFGGWACIEAILSSIPYEKGLEFADYLKKLKKTASGVLSETVDSSFLAQLHTACLGLFFKLEIILYNIADSHMQRFFREVDIVQLGMFLRFSSDALRTKIFRHMGRGSVRMLQKDIDEYRDIALAAYNRARKYLINIIVELAASGEIILDWDLERAMKHKAELEADPYENLLAAKRKAR